jgi:hypothetical protein
LRSAERPSVASWPQRNLESDGLTQPCWKDTIADNQLALNAGWDEELLHLELAALQNEDFNLGLIGFEDEELARLLAAQENAAGLTDEDAVPELPETPVSILGDLWAMGNHKLLVGDATPAGP